MKQHAKWSSEDVQTVLALYETKPAAEIAAMLGRSAKSIYHVVNLRGVKKSSEALGATQRLLERPAGFVRAQFKPRHGMSTEVGGSRNPTYTAWRSMRARCTDASRKDFKRYGGRGISVCSRWDLFEAFLADMGEKPHKAQLGRIDNDGNYEPSNCRWETAVQQARNRCSNVVLEAFGQSKCLAEWCEEFGIRQDTLSWRLKGGMSAEAALTKPVATPKRLLEVMT